MKYEENVQAVKSLSGSILRKVLMKAVLKKLPFLASGPLNALLIKAVSLIVEEALEEAEMRFFFKYIDVRTVDQGSEFMSIMIKNQTIQKIGTEDEKKAVEKELEDALLKLVNLRL